MEPWIVRYSLLHQPERHINPRRPPCRRKSFFSRLGRRSRIAIVTLACTSMRPLQALEEGRELMVVLYAADLHAGTPSLRDSSAVCGSLGSLSQIMLSEVSRPNSQATSHHHTVTVRRPPNAMIWTSTSRRNSRTHLRCRCGPVIRSLQRVANTGFKIGIWNSTNTRKSELLPYTPIAVYRW
jgi:hypothetical protein